MSKFIRPEIERDQAVLFPMSLGSLIAVGHPVRKFDAIISGKAFRSAIEKMRASYKSPELGGKPAYDPATLTKLVIYCTYIGENSSRRMEAACFNRIDVRWLTANLTPDHVTICNFLRDQRELFQMVFESTLVAAKAAKLLTLRHVAVDGTKIEACANPDSAKREETLLKDLEDARRLIARLESERRANDAEEASLEAAGHLVTASPEKDLAAAEKRAAQIEDALEALERRRETRGHANGGQGPNARVSTTDPDAPLMHDKEGRIKPNYTAQAAVDADSGLIVATAISDNPWDGGVLVEMVESAETNTGLKICEVSADSAYNDGPALAAMEEKSIATYLPDSGKSGPISDERASALAAARNGETLDDGRIRQITDPRTKRLSREAFRFDAERNVCICPQGKILERKRTHPDKKARFTTMRTQYAADPADCAACPLRSNCLGKKERFRMVTRDDYEPARDRQRERMATPEGKAKYKKRTTVERAWAWIKRPHGLRKLMRRRFAGARLEFSLACIALNMRILIAEMD